jgi:hypothetical protein
LSLVTAVRTNSSAIHSLVYLDDATSCASDREARCHCERRTCKTAAWSETARRIRRVLRMQLTLAVWFVRASILAPKKMTKLYNKPRVTMRSFDFGRLAYHRAKAEAYGDAGMYEKARSHARAARRASFGTEREMREIRSLLSVGGIGQIGQIKELKDEMATYIASPWDAIDQVIMDGASYGTMRRRAEAENVDLACDPRETAHVYQQKLCQSHAGDLLEHSQWSALQILKWSIERDRVMAGVSLETAIVSAFFHDVGKGGDCVETCIGETCWRDMYSKAKYDGKGEQEHPVRSGDMILGKTPFVVDCAKNRTMNVRRLIEITFKGVSVRHVALAAYMHWEFGKLNIPGEPAEKIAAYFRAFEEACARCELRPYAGSGLLRLCIAVACADITAGTNRRLLPDVSGIIPAPEKYLGKDPWTLFAMDKKYLVYRKMLLAAHKSRVARSVRLATYRSASRKHSMVSALLSGGRR